MTGQTIMIAVPTINITPLEEVPPSIAAPDEPVAAVLMNMLGDLTGRTLLVFPKPTAIRLGELLLRRPHAGGGELTELEQSAIKEAGNILSGAYMNALSDFLGMLLLPSPPTLVIDMSQSVLESAFGDPATDSDSILCVESEFVLTDLDQSLRGFFLLLPDPASLQVMLQALRLA